MKAYIPILLVIVLALVSGFAGYTWSSMNSAAKVAVARSDTTTCTDSASAIQKALDETERKLKTLREDHARLMKDAEKTLDLRDDEIADLTRKLDARQGAIRKAGKYDTQCKSLATDPLCPAIARELWPAAAAQAGPEPAGHH